jgi:hypothetical protein
MTPWGPAHGSTFARHCRVAIWPTRLEARSFAQRNGESERQAQRTRPTMASCCSAAYVRSGRLITDAADTLIQKKSSRRRKWQRRLPNKQGIHRGAAAHLPPLQPLAGMSRHCRIRMTRSAQPNLACLALKHVRDFRFTDVARRERCNARIGLDRRLAGRIDRAGRLRWVGRRRRRYQHTPGAHLEAPHEGLRIPVVTRERADILIGIELRSSSDPHVDPSAKKESRGVSGYDQPITLQRSPQASRSGSVSAAEESSRPQSSPARSRRYQTRNLH